MRLPSGCRSGLSATALARSVPSRISASDQQRSGIPLPAKSDNASLLQQNPQTRNREKFPHDHAVAVQTIFSRRGSGLDWFVGHDSPRRSVRGKARPALRIRKTLRPTGAFDAPMHLDGMPAPAPHEPAFQQPPVPAQPRPRLSASTPTSSAQLIPRASVPRTSASGCRRGRGCTRSAS